MLNKTIAKFVFYAVCVILFTWTSSLTYSFLSMALPNAFFLVPLLGLVVFDVGMIAWLLVFLGHAEGAIQRAVSIGLTLINFIGVSLMVIAEILIDGQQLAETPALLGSAAIWGIGLWTIINVLGVLVFHLGDNQARRAMAYQTEKDAIYDAALSDLKTRRIAVQKTMSAEISAAMMDELIAELRTDIDGAGGRPDALDNPYGRVTHPILRDQIDHGQLPPQPPIPQLEKEPVTYPNGHSRG